MDSTAHTGVGCTTQAGRVPRAWVGKGRQTAKKRAVRNRPEVMQVKWSNVVLSFVLVPVLAGCHGIGMRQDVRINQVDELGDHIENVHVETEIARQRVRDALAMLQVVANNEYRGDPVVAYSDFVAAIDASENQAGVMRDNVEPMVDSANTFFGEWGQDLESFSSSQMRNLSRTRLATTHQRYKAIAQMITPAMGLFDELNLRFRDSATFLAYDFNPASIEAIQADVKDMERLAAKLDKRFAASMKATHAYVESTRMPPVAQLPEEDRTER